MNSLLPCPFCGCKVSFRRHMQVTHPENDCLLSGIMFSDSKAESECEHIWNRRISPPAVEQETVREEEQIAKNAVRKLENLLPGSPYTHYGNDAAFKIVMAAIQEVKEKEPSDGNALNLWIKDTAYRAAHDFYNENGPAHLSLSETRERFHSFLKGALTSSPSSPLLETNREEDSAPPAQPQSDRAKNPTGQATSI